MAEDSKNLIFTKDIIEEVSLKLKMKKKDTKAVLEEIFSYINHCIETGKNVRIKNFGKFLLYYVKPRIARDLSSQEFMEVCAKNKLVFRPVVRLKDTVTYGVTLAGHDYSSRYENEKSRKKVIERLARWIKKNDEEKTKSEEKNATEI